METSTKQPPSSQACKMCLERILHFGEYKYNPKKHLKEIIPQFTSLCQSNNDIGRIMPVHLSYLQSIWCTPSPEITGMCLFPRWGKHIFLLCFPDSKKKKKSDNWNQAFSAPIHYIKQRCHCNTILTLLYISIYWPSERSKVKKALHHNNSWQCKTTNLITSSNLFTC